MRALGAHAQVATREHGGVARLGETDDALLADVGGAQPDVVATLDAVNLL